MGLELRKGNISDLRKDYRGWIIGSFVDKSSPFHNENFEVKWIDHKKGDLKENLNPFGAKMHTLAILLSGVFKLSFLNENKEFVLEKNGEYLFYSEVVPHIGEAIEDCQLITLRWLVD